MIIHWRRCMTQLDLTRVTFTLQPELMGCVGRLNCAELGKLVLGLI